MPDSPPPVDRRGFIRKTAATGAALGLSAASYARVPGANERLGVIAAMRGEERHHACIHGAVDAPCKRPVRAARGPLGLGTRDVATH